MKAGLLRGTFLISFGLLTASVPALGEHRMISIGDRRLSMDCDREKGAATVVLFAGGGRLAKDWAKVQPAVANFARVCSYDRAGFGESDKTTSKLQPVGELPVPRSAPHESRTEEH
jgi:pimeloyl-ACP methyl ester carboxylesterase